jgi:hypothetical protein
MKHSEICSSKHSRICEISGSHGGEYEVQSLIVLIMEAARTSETSVDIPEDSELHSRI